MPLMLGGGAEDDVCGFADGATPFRLPKLDVFGEKKGRSAKKRAEVASEDEEDPREEAQVSVWFLPVCGVRWVGRSKALRTEKMRYSGIGCYIL